MGTVDVTKHLMPRRGNRSTMLGVKKDIVLQAGEIFIEYPDTGVGTGACLIKVGDGNTTYENLPYGIGDSALTTVAFNEDTSSTVEEAINKIVTGSSLAEIIAALKKVEEIHSGDSSIHVTNENKDQWDKAQANIIETVSVNGSELTPSEKNVDIELPVTGIKVNNVEVAPDASHNANIIVPVTSVSVNNVAAVPDDSHNVNITIPVTAISVNGEDVTPNNGKVNVAIPDAPVQSVSVDGKVVNPNESGEVAITLPTIPVCDFQASKNSTNGSVEMIVTHGDAQKSVAVKGTGVATVTTDENGVIIVNTPKAAEPTHKHSKDDITSVNASVIEGIINIENLPKAALERLVPVTDDTARFTLTTDNVQEGDVVKVTKTGLMYYVVDSTKLSSEAGYEPFTAGTAASVPWSGVTGKPDTFTPSSHTHTIADVTGLQSTLDGKAASSHTHTMANITDLKAMTGATSAAAGKAGLVPAPASGAQGKYLRGDGTWQTPTNTTYGAATTSTNGLLTSGEKTFLNTINASDKIWDFGDEG